MVTRLTADGSLLNALERNCPDFAPGQLWFVQLSRGLSSYFLRAIRPETSDPRPKSASRGNGEADCGSLLWSAAVVAGAVELGVVVLCPVAGAGDC